MIRRPPRSTLFPTRRSSDLKKRPIVFDHDLAKERDDVVLAHLNHRDRKSTRLNSSHLVISYAVFCLKKKKSSYLPSRHHGTSLHALVRSHVLHLTVEHIDVV